jgi:predicted NAD/FAD-dependent oxidoreductase
MKDTVDIAIVGTGISGAHCAYQLHLTHPHFRVVVYEASKASGGRVVNQDGPSSDRVVAPSLQPRTRDLLAMLRIPTRRTSQLHDSTNVYFS